MRRPDYSDIPDVFKRAFEGQDPRNPGGTSGGDGDDEGGNRGGGGGGNDGDGNENNPPFGSGTPLWQTRRFWIFLIIFVLFIGINQIVSYYTDFLWFTERGYRAVWSTQIVAYIGTFAAFFVVASIFLLVSWHVAQRNALKIATPYFGTGGLSSSAGRYLVTGVALLLAFMMASAASTMWEEFLLFFNQVPFGQVDPIFGNDIGFYVFSLPIFTFIQGWLMPLTVFSIIGTVVIYTIRLLPSLPRQGQTIQFTMSDVPVPMRRQLAILGAIFFVLLAINYNLNRYELLFSERGVVFGAGYTDINASLYALYIQAAAAAVVAIALLYNYFRLELRPVIYAGILWLVAIIGVGGIYPSLLQAFVVVPNELAREEPFIQYNIDFTRMAFGLDKVDSKPFGDVSVLNQADLDDNDAALKNIRLWDYRPLLNTYKELQELRPYYQIQNVDIDRYEVDGETRQVMLAARELNKAGLESDAWVNQRLEYTHGYGLVMNPVDRFNQQGRPEFFISDLPPVSTIGIEVDRPEIYYGETTNDIVFAGSDLDEFNYPDATENIYTSYAGTGGVALSSAVRRLAYAYQFGETNLLFSQYITPQTRVMYHRNITERVQEITPFLALDGDPYIVLADGKLYWMVDAYTTSNRFPYSDPTQLASGRSINYIRNSVKVVIDAYNGEVTYYLVRGNEDPIIDAYDRIFPGLFNPASSMPATLQQHLRYPEDLFKIQTRKYQTYHMTDVQEFFTKEDLWAIPQEVFYDAPQEMEPYYVLFTLPGQEEPEYLLIQPYTPSGKKNMIAWIAARNDPEFYGQLASFEFPKQSLVVGPIQVESFIDQEPDISQQLSLWNQLGSSVIRGNLIVIPLNDSFLYVEPIYLESDNNQLPELKRVIVASGERVVMRETLDEALKALLEDRSAPAVIITDDPNISVSEPSTPIELVIDGTLAELIGQANAQFEAAQEAQQQGDWAEYGSQIEALENTLQQLEALNSE
ncbi:MAG: uncharacterized membrane protein (UPF0182 family) [Cellvibrionaceae bacterium]|jgi:uncharacterized membrane protein (UPF0182 family)